MYPKHGTWLNQYTYVEHVYRLNQGNAQSTVIKSGDCKQNWTYNAKNAAHMRLVFGGPRLSSREQSPIQNLAQHKMNKRWSPHNMMHHLARWLDINKHDEMAQTAKRSDMCCSRLYLTTDQWLHDGMCKAFVACGVWSIITIQLRHDVRHVTTLQACLERNNQAWKGWSFTLRASACACVVTFAWADEDALYVWVRCHA